MEMVVPTFGSILIQLPVFLVWLAGGVLAVLYWRKHPRVSLLALLAMALFAALALTSSVLNIWLPMTMVGRGISATQMGFIFTARGLVQALLSAVGWGLVLGAIFGWRGE